MDEYENIIVCLRKFGTGNAADSNVEKHSIKKIAERNKVWPIIEFVSGSYEKKAIYKKNKEDQVLRIGSCIDIFNKLEKMNIRYAVIKGAFLDKVAYRDLGLRKSGDIDILIDKKDYRKLCELLDEAEFVCGYWNDETNEVCRYSRKTILYNYLYTHQAAPYLKSVENDKGVQIIDLDINFSISWGEDKRGGDITAQILDNTCMIEYGEYQYRVLLPEYFLLQLCLHSYRDMNSIVLIYEDAYVLRLLCDVYYYIVNVQDDIVPEKFLQIAREYNYERNVYYVLHYVTKVFGENEWIGYVMSQFQVGDDTFINNYGLAEDEIKRWPIEFSERVICDNLFGVIKQQLTDSDLKKIDSIVNNM